MWSGLRFSMRETLMAVALVALLLTVVVLTWQIHQVESRHLAAAAEFKNRLNALYQLVDTLPVAHPDRAYVLASPPFAYGRWAWRVYLPEGRRYALHVAVGTVREQNGVPVISGARGHVQHFGLVGQGETAIVAEHFHQDNQTLLGVTVGTQDVCCRLTRKVAHRLATRAPYEEEQLGDAAPVEVAAGKRIELVKRWYPSSDIAASDPLSDAAVGFSVWLEPF